MQQLRIYLVGAGVIAHSHAQAINTLPDPASVLLSVADPSPQALATFTEKFPQARTYSDITTMLAESVEPDDIVVVATPPSTHCELTLQAFATGRHVLCEKPLAMSREEAGQMLAAARAADRLLGCCSTRLIDDQPTNTARQYVAEGKLGQLYHMRFMHRQLRARAGIDYQPSSRWFLDRSKSGGGVLMDWGGYDFTTLNYILQPVQVEVLHAWMTSPHIEHDVPEDVVNDVEQHVGATLRYTLSNGDRLTLNYERSATTHGEELMLDELEGLDGALKWTWPGWGRTNTITYTHNADGASERLGTVQINTNKLSFLEKPLHYFYLHTQGQPSPSPVNEQAIFNFSCMRAIYDYIATGEKQIITVSGDE